MYVNYVFVVSFVILFIYTFVCIYEEKEKQLIQHVFLFVFFFFAKRKYINEQINSICQIMNVLFETEETCASFCGKENQSIF